MELGVVNVGIRSVSIPIQKTQAALSGLQAQWRKFELVAIAEADTFVRATLILNKCETAPTLVMWLH
jgi:hypothetical protein